MNSEITLKAEDILLVDMGLVNRCNLACPLCPYVARNIKSQPKNEVDFQDYINFLDSLPNLEVAIIEGNYSEPTFYSKLPELISYLASRGIRIRLSTNGNTHTEKYWKDLGTRFGPEDIVRFAIDGSTQELHSKYRVNGKLSKVLTNHTALKSSGFKGKSVLQNIIFQYNVSDKENIYNIFREYNFDYLSYLKCYPSSHEVFKPVPEIHKYNNIFNRLAKDSSLNILCDAYSRKEIYVNHEGQVFLCGSLDEGGDYKNNPKITDDLSTIFDFITYTARNIRQCNTCKYDCNYFCYNLGESYPDILIDREGKETEVNYFTKELYNEEGNIHHQLI